MIDEVMIDLEAEVENKEHHEAAIKDICMQLTTGDFLEATRPFLESENCQNVLEEYFDDHLLSMMPSVEKFPKMYNIDDWTRRVSMFFRDVKSDMAPEEVKKAMEKKSKYLVLDLLAQRQAILTITEQYSKSMYDMSNKLYALCPPQFSKIVKECQDSDKIYLPVLNQKV